MFIEIVRPEETFEHVVLADDGKTPTQTCLTLRIVDDSVEKEIRRKATGKPTFERGQRVENFDGHKFLAGVLDHAIVTWRGVRHRGQELPCELTYKLLLPERVKTDIVRLCLGKEASEAREAAGDEKKD